MPPSYHFREELKEKGQEEQTYMHTIYVGIGSNYNIIIPQVIDIFLNIQSSLQKIKLLIFIDDLFCEPEGIKRFSLQTKNSLSIDITRLGDRSAGRITFGNKYGGFKLAFIIR